MKEKVDIIVALSGAGVFGGTFAAIWKIITFYFKRLDKSKKEEQDEIDSLVGVSENHKNEIITLIREEQIKREAIQQQNKEIVEGLLVENDQLKTEILEITKSKVKYETKLKVLLKKLDEFNTDQT